MPLDKILERAEEELQCALEGMAEDVYLCRDNLYNIVAFATMRVVPLDTNTLRRLALDVPDLHTTYYQGSEFWMERFEWANTEINCVRASLCQLIYHHLLNKPVRINSTVSLTPDSCSVTYKPVISHE